MFRRNRFGGGDDRGDRGGYGGGGGRSGGYSGSGGGSGGYGGGGSGGGGFEQRTFAPVKVGEELDVKIEAVGEKGDGIAKKNGFVLFIPGVKEGDEVKIRVTKVLRKVGFAEVVGRGGEATAENAPESTSEGGSYEEAPAPQEETPNQEDSESFGEEEEQY